METYQALKAAIKDKAAHFAKRLIKSPSLVYKWTEPAEDPEDSGALNPLDRMELLIEIAILLNHPRGDCLAPLDYLEHRFDRIAFDIPKKDHCSLDSSQDLLRAVKEFGELAAEGSKAIANNSLTSQAMAAIEKEGFEAMKEIYAFIYCTRQKVSFNRR